MQPHFHIKLNREGRLDLKTWHDGLRMLYGKTFFIQQQWITNDTLSLYTDASSTIGFGAVFQNKWFASTWPEEWQQFDITMLELYPIFATLHVWGRQWANKSILLYTDNQAIMHYFNKQTSKDKNIMSLIRPFKLQ